MILSRFRDDAMPPVLEFDPYDDEDGPTIHPDVWEWEWDEIDRAVGDALAADLPQYRSQIEDLFAAARDLDPYGRRASMALAVQRFAEALGVRVA